MPIPVAHVQIHQRWPAGSTPAPARMSVTTRAVAQQAVITPVTSRSFASRSGARGRCGFSRFTLARGSPVTSTG
jgi:hypothetical protein